MEDWGLFGMGFRTMEVFLVFDGSKLIRRVDFYILDVSFRCLLILGALGDELQIQVVGKECVQQEGQ